MRPDPASRTLHLHPHPASPPADGAAVSVALRRAAGGGLHLHFTLTVPGLRVPATGVPLRCDGLWRTTCCELFLGMGDGAAYREFNFSPSGAWAAYDFIDYRVPAANLPEGPPPTIRSRADGLALQVDVELDAAWRVFAPGAMLGLSVVTEAADGGLAYWALRHPAARPDFHDAASRTLSLADMT